MNEIRGAVDGMFNESDLFMNFCSSAIKYIFTMTVQKLNEINVCTQRVNEFDAQLHKIAKLIKEYSE